MPTEDSPRRVAKHWQDCTNVYDFLEQIRLRPGAWLSGGSLRDLQSMLIGYQVAVGVHSITEPCDFWHGGAFSQWLGKRLGGSSPLGWAADIERNTPNGSTSVEEFFHLLDTYRSDAPQNPEPTAATTPPPGIEYMSNTFVTLFWRRRLLTQAEQQLEEHGFRVVRLAAGEWTTEQDMHRAIADALDFPDYYGRNLDALINSSPNAETLRNQASLSDALRLRRFYANAAALRPQNPSAAGRVKLLQRIIDAHGYDG